MGNIVEEIQVWQHTEALQTLERCGLHHGMDVMDFGCGAMYWTLPAAKLAGKDGHVYAMDGNKQEIDFVNRTCEQLDLSQIIPIRMTNDKMSSFDQMTDFILYYDVFHCVGGPTMERKIQGNKELMKEFHRLLRPDGRLTVSVFREIGMVQDRINGPFTPKGRPKWFHVDYKEGLERYGVIDLIEQCGFELIDTIVDAAIHFDEIEKHLDQEEVAHKTLHDLERRDIWVFRKR